MSANLAALAYLVAGVLFILALLLLGMARPTAKVTLPSNRATVILAIDVSGSMRSSDVTPSRIEAAQAAAKAQSRHPCRPRAQNDHRRTHNLQFDCIHPTRD